MLVPALVRANYKVTTSQTVTLESILGSNLPLLFPEILVYNRTGTACSLTTSGLRRVTFTNQSDADFDGNVTSTLFTTFSLAAGLGQKLSGLDQSLLPSEYGVTTEITFANAGPAAEVWVSLVIKGMVETSLQADPLLVVNV